MKPSLVLAFSTVLLFGAAAHAQKPIIDVRNSRGGKAYPEAAGGLTSGVPISFAFPVVSSNTLFCGDYGFTFTVPTGISSDARLEIKLTTSTPGADVDLFVRYGQDVALSNNHVAADYRSDTLTGNESITIRAPALQPGVYYIGFGLLTFGVQVNSTILATLTSVSTQPPPTGMPSNALTVSQFVTGGGWATSLFVTNLSAYTENFTVRFFGSNGSAQRMPIAQLGSVDTISASVAAGETRVYETTDPGTLREGWAILTPATPSAARLSGFSVFRSHVAGQTDSEAIVPLVGVTGHRYVVLYDNANGFETAVAVVNSSSSTLTVACTLRDQAGLTLSTQTLTLPPLGHTAFQVSQKYPASASRRGSLQLTANSAGVVALGLRFNPAGTFTSFPALTSPDMQQ